MIRRFLLTIAFIVLGIVPVSFAVSHPVRGAEFLYDYDVTYVISESGKTRVTQNITLANQTTEILARHFTLTVESSDVSNVVASDSRGSIEPVVEKNPGQTRITVVFNKLQAGIGKTQSFTIAFDSFGVALKKGRIWEVLVPGVKSKPEINSYRVNMQIPPSFGKPAYVTPPPENDGYWDLVKHPGGIALAFGDYQTFQFTLEYTLKNENRAKKVQTLALPSDTSYQKVVINRLSIEPDSVESDGDGNWIASYTLQPSESIQVVAEGVVQTRYKPDANRKQILTPEERQKYIFGSEYWDLNQAQVEKAKELGNARAIYDYVTQTLKYDFGRVNADGVRLGARGALESPQKALCLEYADLFVALARAAGIPARLVEGYAHTSNNHLQPLSLIADVLHAWPQYYDEEKKMWLSIDPTWSATTGGIDYFNKLDFNHISFAVLGLNSSDPKVAGTYKSETSGKDVFIEFIEDATIPEPAVDLELLLPDLSLSGFETRGQLLVKNTGVVAAQIDELVIDSKAEVSYSAKMPLIVPPYSTLSIPLSFKIPFSITDKPVSLSVDAGLADIKKEVRLAGLATFLLRNVQAIFLLLLVFILVPLIHVYGTRSKKNS